MPESESEGTDSKVVVIGGKRLTISDVRKSFGELEFLTTGGAVKVIDILINTQEPLTREQISSKADLSMGYVVEVLRKLLAYDYVAAFHIGKRKLIYYAITDQGYNALTKKKRK
nr:hypothetical protein [Candidatus Njordarchaeota archaeon]